MKTVTSLPCFDTLVLAQVTQKLDAVLHKNLRELDHLLDSQKNYRWENLLRPLENMNDALHQLWSPIQHLHAVTDSLILRDIVRDALPKLSDYYTAIAQNEKLFHAINSIHNSKYFHTLSAAQQKSIQNDLRDFKLHGVHLPIKTKKQFATLSKKLSQLTHQFEENVLDATMAWKKHITDTALLSGIPEHAVHRAQENAKKEGKPGYLFTLEAPDYLAVMLYADSSDLRFELYQAYVTRASDCGPTAGEFDNSIVMQQIVETRFAMAKLLGYENYAQYSLATKMAKHTDEVLSFLNHLVAQSLPKARDEFRQLTEFAHAELELTTLHAWDIAYASEKLRQKYYALSQEDLRPYFPEDHVLAGLFHIMNRLYDITVEKAPEVSVWHSDVKCFRVMDAKKNTQAYVYFDLYAREKKRAGAWMDECSVRRQLDNDDIQLPAAYVICNFNAPMNNHPALFTHQDVETLFHECGHALQHILTQIDVAAVSGINNIPWDAVEIASQFFENWAWEKESVSYFAKHYQTQENLPPLLFQRMSDAKNFQSAMQMMRQLEFALFDFHLHMDYNSAHSNHIQEIVKTVRQQVAVIQPPDFNRFQHSFSHIFGGQYAAGYYSYKWAEVLACDAFSLFQETGIFNQQTSQKFKTTFLEQGGAVDPMELFIQFRGRKPTVNALLQQSGIL